MAERDRWPQPRRTPDGNPHSFQHTSSPARYIRRDWDREDTDESETYWGEVEPQLELEKQFETRVNCFEVEMLSNHTVRDYTG